MLEERLWRNWKGHERLGRKWKGHERLWSNCQLNWVNAGPIRVCSVYLRGLLARFSIVLRHSLFHSACSIIISIIGLGCLMENGTAFNTHALSMLNECVFLRSLAPLRACFHFVLGFNVCKRILRVQQRVTRVCSSPSPPLCPWSV